MNDLNKLYTYVFIYSIPNAVGKTTFRNCKKITYEELLEYESILNKQNPKLEGQLFITNYMEFEQD